MLKAVEGNICQRLRALLGERQVRYRVAAHDMIGQYEAVSAIRGTALGQGVKALVRKVKRDGANQHVLTILVVGQQIDFAGLARHTGGGKTLLASPAEVGTLTVCAFDAIPPFSFHPVLRLVTDPLLFGHFP